MKVLGIDIGGSGTKGAPVDTARGVLVAERIRIPTPKPAKPQAVAGVVAEIVHHFGWKGGAIGCAFPAVIKQGVAYSAANVHRSWIGTDGESLLEEATQCPYVGLDSYGSQRTLVFHYVRVVIPPSFFLEVEDELPGFRFTQVAQCG